MLRERRLSLAAVSATAGLLLFASTGFGWLDPATDPSVVISVTTADSQLSFYQGPSAQTEWLKKNGSLAAVRLKGHQDVSIFKFNLGAYRGQTVEQAELHLARANSDTVFSLVASTVNTDWNESYVCYRYRTGTTDWTFNHSDAGTAAFGNYGSLVCYGYAQDDTFKTYTVGTQNWIAMKLRPDLVHAMILDQPGGLVVTDPRNHLLGNPTVYTRVASGLQPRLYIKFASAADTTPPNAVTGLAVTAGPRSGQVVLNFDAPTDPQAAKAFGYDVRYSIINDFATAVRVDRWRIARPKTPGAPQKVLLEGLTTGNTYYFFVQAYDAAGNGSTVASTSLSMPFISPPTIPDGAFTTPNPAGKTVRTVPGVLNYWAAYETTKVNPVTGNRIEENYASTTAYENYKKANVVWDAATNTISLRACRNEVVGAQLVIQRLVANLTNVQVTVSDLVGPAGQTIPSNPYVELFQVDYVGSGNYQYPEAAIPLSAPFATTFGIPDANRNPTGGNQTVWMDLYVPKDAEVTNYTGTVTIAAAQLSSPVTINLKVRVSPVVIPDDPSFFIDLNGYGNPWDFGSNYTTTCLRYFQVCHKHRAVPNTVPYSWNGTVNYTDRAPGVTGTQPNIFIAGWTYFDNKYGKLFDGSAFLPTTPGSPYYGPGTGTPVTHFYTCFNDSWPMQIRNDNYGFDPKYGPERIPGMPMKGGLYWTNLIDSNASSFFATAPDTFAAFADSFQRVNREFLADWIEHAAAKGWTKTAFECYLNNKYSYSGANSLWTLEECETADDFRAVGFYHQLYRDGQAAANQPQIPWHFRVDISDRWGQNYGEFDNRINWQVIGSGAASWHWPNREYRKYHLDQDKQETWLSYSDGAGVSTSNIYNTRAMLQRWCQGFDGSVVYWDNFGASWDTPDNLCMVYSGQNVPGHGLYEGALVSIRLKALRQVQQLVEMLNLWGNNVEGLNRLLVRDALVMKYGATAWGYPFTTLDETKLYRMRSDLTQTLEEAFFVPGDIDFDGTVNIFDIFRIAEAWGTSEGDAMYDEFTDLDKDGSVNIFDIFVIAENWNQSKPLPEW